MDLRPFLIFRLGKDLAGWTRHDEVAAGLIALIPSSSYSHRLPFRPIEVVGTMPDRTVGGDRPEPFHPCPFSPPVRPKAGRHVLRTPAFRRSNGIDLATRSPEVARSTVQDARLPVDPEGASAIFIPSPGWYNGPDGR